MNCKRCGAELTEGQKFCGVCGEPVPAPTNTGYGQQNPNQQPYMGAYAGNGQQNQQPYSNNGQQNPNQQPYMGAYAGNGQWNPNNAFAEKPRKPKKSKKPVVIVAILAIIAVVAALAIILVPIVKKAFMSEQEIMTMYDRDVIEDSLESLSSSFKTVGGDAEYSGSIGINLSDYLAGQLGAYIGDISSAKVTFDVASKGDNYGCKINLLLGETEIITLDAVVDIKSDKAYIEAPGLVDGALGLDIGMLMPEDGKASVSSLLENMSSVELDDKVIDDVLALIDAAYSAAGDAVKSNEALTVGGISQNCTVYTLTIDEETASKMVVAVLEQLKKSEHIKDFAGDLVENYYSDLTREEIISEIDVFCDSGISSLTEEGITFSDDVIIYKMYVASDEVVGRTVEINNLKITAAYAKNGRDMAFEYSIDQGSEGALKLSGKGTDDKNGFTGEATLVFLESEIVKLEFDKFICDDDELSGSVEISFGNDIEELGIDYDVAAVLSTVKLTLNFDVDSDKSKIGIGISAMNFDLGEILLESTANSKYVPQIPEDITYSDPEDFGSDIDIYELIERLADAGLDLGALMGGY